MGFGGPQSPFDLSISSTFLAMGFGFFFSLSAFFLMLASVSFRFLARVTWRARSRATLVWNIAGNVDSMNDVNGVDAGWTDKTVGLRQRAWAAAVRRALPAKLNILFCKRIQIKQLVEQSQLGLSIGEELML